MHGKRPIHVSILIYVASFISYIEGASLSMLISGSQHFSSIGQYSHSINSTPMDLGQNNYSKRNGDAQPKPDQDVLNLENWRHASDEQEKKLSSLEVQLKTENNGQHSQEETPPIDNIDKKPADSDATLHDAFNDDTSNGNFNTNGFTNGERVPGPPSKNAEYLFKHSGGQYSALDMAQYVFWTGDEEGVARTVEEFIRKSLMSRETAIKFLRDISMGIEYLENAYSTNRQFDKLDVNMLRNEEEYQAKQLIDRTLNGHSKNNHRTDYLYNSNNLIEAVSTTSTTTTTVKPIIVVEKSVNPPFAGLSSPLMKLNELPNERTKKYAINLEESSGRLRLADLIYAEYSLEEVIYQLAKVMFAQSLSKGSDETQMVFQRLTIFLATEGASGRISPALQKKVLDVLLVALSDCLTEKPQLISAARLSLGEATITLPKSSDKH